MPMKYPRRFLTGHPEYDLDVEVFEIKEELNCLITQRYEHV